ncbi:MAG: virulence RhuM family protein [Desulfatiglans sp.]|nr:virulence RhuM family protein [Desulfatiglans sp.]
MTEKNNQSEIILYKTDDGRIKVDTVFQNETIWLTQAQMSELFDVNVPAISKHLKNIFDSGELDEDSVVSILETTATDGKNYKTKYFNLDAIIAVGYRVNSKRATQFRIWASNILKEYIIKGFAMDDERLKNLGGGGYWKELLQRIRDIRSSEKVFYRQVLDIYATSIDYDPMSDVSIEFFKKVQNKIHYAVHGQTAAEVIFDRADAEKEFMGLMSFPGSRPFLKDVVIAKNYLNENELRSLGQIVSGYLDFAERQAERKQSMTMKDWTFHLDKILTMSGEKLLQGAGSVSHETAIEKATVEYKKYQQKTLSDVENKYIESLKVIENISKKQNVPKEKDE